jgi:hypothetical protein
MVMFIAVVLTVLLLTPGWYKVHFRDNAQGPLYCDLTLVDIHQS